MAHMSWIELQRLYERHLQVHGSSHQTIISYGRSLDQFYQFVGERDVSARDALTPDRIAKFIDDRRVAGHCANTLRRHLVTLSSFAKFGMKVRDPRGRYALDHNPVDRVVRPRAVPPPERWLTLDEVRALLAEARPFERLPLVLLVDQPLRASEWCRANVGDVTWNADGAATIEVIVKGGRRRKKRLGQGASAMLRENLAIRSVLNDPTAPLLVHRGGTRWTRQGFSNLVNRVAKRAGLKRQVRAHALRHAIASAAAEGGATLYEIAEMLNHSSLATAQRYIHGVSPDAALDRVRRALGS